MPPLHLLPHRRGRRTGWTIVLDAGHGGEDGGAVSRGGVPESGINLQIAKKMQGLLAFLGARVCHDPRGRGRDLLAGGEDAAGKEGLRPQKPRRAHQRHARRAAREHPPEQPALASVDARGAGVLQRRRPRGEVAQGVQQALNVSLGGGKTVKAMDGGVYLMKQIRCPGVLVECGFLSNDKEAAHLQTEEHQRRLAAAILAGLLQYSTKEG